MNKFGAYGFVLLFGAAAMGSLSLAYNDHRRLASIEQRVDELMLEIDLVKIRTGTYESKDR